VGGGGGGEGGGGAGTGDDEQREVRGTGGAGVGAWSGMDLLRDDRWGAGSEPGRARSVGGARGDVKYAEHAGRGAGNGISPAAQDVRLAARQRRSGKVVRRFGGRVGVGGDGV